MADFGADRAPGEADLAVCIGGDGTMLRTVHLLHGAPVPVIGVNVGLLGYLTEVEPPALAAALERFFAGPEVGNWTIDERMMVDLTLRRHGVDVQTWTALNEGVVEKQESGHTVRLQVTIDGAPFTSYAADGLILATPTGSTAYSMSARGPVVSPRTRAVLLTPVSPHMLFDRTLVLDPSESVEVEVMGHRAVTLSVDGQPTNDAAGVTYAFATRKVGDTARVQIRRDERESTLSVRTEAAPNDPAPDERTFGGQTPLTGATAINLSPAKAEELGIDAFAGPGVLITKVDGISARAGIQPGDFIRSINGTQTANVRALGAVLAAPQRSWAVEVERNGERGTLRF